jgi:alpha-glucoside transport system permease protein|tara:strand:- start:1479 stop:2459 length:981 start_codon:yes stop_codon:yes gene_type:complete
LFSQVLQSILVVFLAVTISIGYFVAANWTLKLWGEKSNSNLPEKFKPWVFLFPALFLVSLYLIYPIIETVRLSFYNNSGRSFVGLDNYIWLLGDDEVKVAVRNNFMWLFIVPTISTGIGLVAAVLADRVWWGTFAKTLIFMPMAISFVGASVIWKFVYDLRPIDVDQIGLLNAILVKLGSEPMAWITIPFWNNFFLMIILIWIQTGFAMVILSAALRGLSSEVIEASRMDGASEFQIFYKIMIPQILSTIMVVWTTITIIVLKVFDIVVTMTNGQWDTGVLANLMFNWMFVGGDFGRGSLIALIIMIGVIPIMFWNIKRLRQEELI